MGKDWQNRMVTQVTAGFKCCVFRVDPSKRERDEDVFRSSPLVKRQKLSTVYSGDWSGVAHSSKKTDDSTNSSVMADIALLRMERDTTPKVLCMIQCPSDNVEQEDITQQIQELAYASLSDYDEMVVIGFKTEGFYVVSAKRDDENDTISIRESGLLRFSNDMVTIFSCLLHLIITMACVNKDVKYIR